LLDLDFARNADESAVYFGNSSPTIERSSFSSLMLASILPRANSLIGSP